MHAFEYARPSTIEEAVRLLGADWADAAVLAGGTDLISLMKDEVVVPKRVVSLNGIDALRRIRQTQTHVVVGALATIEELLAHPGAEQDLAALVQAARGIASPQLQAMGTVVGEILQRPRCWYFRGGFGLLPERNGRSMVVDGDNRYHAIFGGGPAYFVHASSLAPGLVALEATVAIVGPQGTREVALERFFTVPKAAGERENVLRPNEVVTELRIPRRAGRRSATYEVRERQALDWPLAAAAVVLAIDQGRVASARVALGHVAPVPWRAVEAEKVLAGQKVDEGLAERAAAAGVTGARPLSRNAYKVTLARTALKRAILQAAAPA